MSKENNNEKSINSRAWKKPTVENLGNAKDIVANVNVQGAGDSVFSVLDPS